MAVEAINRDLCLVLMVGGSTVPVTNWLDERGEDCEAADAVFAVAGPASDGRWHTLDLSEFEQATTN